MTLWPGTPDLPAATYRGDFASSHASGSASRRSGSARRDLIIEAASIKTTKPFTID